ncbi:hypothetical protein [Pedococcus soli]
MSHMTEPTAWDALRLRIGALAPQRRAAFALACAEHLVAMEATPREAELRAALVHGWEALLGAQDDLGPLRARLEIRADLDDDEVAGVALALGAVMGGSEDAWWAANRARDAADARVSYREPSFRPTDADAAERIMQNELNWQLDAITALEVDEPLSTVVTQLRS